MLNPRRVAIVEDQDVIPCGDLGEEILLRDLDEQIKALFRRKPQGWSGTLNALGVSVEYWLDLHRDGCNAQIEDFNDLFTLALKFTIKQKPIAKERS